MSSKGSKDSLLDDSEITTSLPQEIEELKQQVETLKQQVQTLEGEKKALEEKVTTLEKNWKSCWKKSPQWKTRLKTYISTIRV